MKAPITDQSTPKISDEENENSFHFTDKVRLTIPSRKNQNRFRRSTGKMNALLECLKNIKACYEFKGLDFKSDLVKLYTEVRSVMAEKYDRNDFDSVITAEIGDDLSTEELAKQKAAVAEEQKMIKIGYQRIKQNKKFSARLQKCSDCRQTIWKWQTSGGQLGDIPLLSSERSK